MGDIDLRQSPPSAVAVFVRRRPEINQQNKFQCYQIIS